MAACRVRWRSGASRGPEPGRSSDVARRQERHPRGRDLDTERQAVEAAANLRDGIDVLRHEPILGTDPLRTIHEQADRVVGECLIDRGAGTGHGQRRDRELLLARDAQRSAAGHQDLDLRSPQDVGDDGRGVEDVLEIVEEQ